MVKYIYKSSNQNQSTLEVTKITEGKQIIDLQITEGENKISHKLTERQLLQLKNNLDDYYKVYQENKPSIAKVSFYGIEGNKINKQYCFLTDIKTLQKDDYVLVDSMGKECVAKFIKYVNNPNIYPTKRIIKKYKAPYQTNKYVFIIPPKKEELTEKGFTNKIKIAEKQTVESLLSYGFSNNHSPTLYFCKNLGSDISFNLSIDKNTLEISNIDILDENFLQPFDYQSMILNGKTNDFNVSIYHKVNDIMAKLQFDGVITGFEKGMYI